MEVLSRFNTEQGIRILLDFTKEDIDTLQQARATIQSMIWFLNDHGCNPNNESVKVAFELLGVILGEANGSV